MSVRPDEVNAQDRQQQPAEATPTASQALAQERLDEAPPRGAQSGAHGDLLLAGRGAGEKEVAHVHGGNQQHEGSGTDQPDQADAELLQCRLAKGHDTNPEMPVDLEVGPAVRSMIVAISARASSQPRAGLSLPMTRSVRSVRAGSRCASGRGTQTVSPGGKPEALRHDTYDRVRLAVECHHPPDDGPIAAEPPLPDVVTQDGDPPAVARGIAREKGSPNDGLSC